ncbi:MAG: NADH-quinone oxidoreductase subunit G [Actinobacteria bacterium]|nr:NADH-quinone oxidoreductase subunit G [Actinomycetota bacterium]
MTVTASDSSESSKGEITPPPVDLVSCTIDGIGIQVPKGTLIIRAAEQIGIEIPRFCDHPLLSPAANCRMCLVEIVGQPKPQPSCAIIVGPDMEIKTANTSTVADQAQRGVMEFLLINHPLDCPVCDKGGECPLQNQAMSHGNGESYFHGVKRTFPKPIAISTQILLDRERCVSCARCTRFSDEIAGDPLIELIDRGAQQQVGIADDKPFDSYFSGNTVQICPVGALTSKDYRFRARPFDLVSTPTACEHCASGCALRTDERRSKVMRRLAWDDPEVNEDWNCDKGRFAFRYLDEDRITHPLVRDEDGQLVVASWPEAIAIAAEKLAAARGTTGVITGGRVTREDAYAYAKFARIALHSDDIDFRVRATSAEETDLLHASVAGSELGVTYAQLELSPMVLMVGLEPEEESPMIFLRLRKGVQAGTSKTAAISSWSSPGFTKTGGVVLAAAPGSEAEVLTALGANSTLLSAAAQDVAKALSEDGAVILVGERLASQPGGISAAAKLAADTGASLAWVPRRAGERGALDAGALAGLLPGGRPLTEASARAEVAAAWGIPADDLPAEAGLTLDGIIHALTTVPESPAATDGGDEIVVDVEGAQDTDLVDVEPAAEDEEFEPRITALVLAGVEIDDFPNPDQFRLALYEATTVISLETRLSAVEAYADVVFPVAVDTERAGSYTDWEGRVRSFGQVMAEATSIPDGRVLAMLSDAMDAPIGSGEPLPLRRELDALGSYVGPRASAPTVSAPVVSAPVAGKARLASWRHLLDKSMLATGEEYLAGTARPSVARMSAATAAGIGANDDDVVTVSNGNGAIVLPLVVTDMPDGVVWVPGNSPGSTLNATLGVVPGAIVDISQGGQA